MNSHQSREELLQTISQLERELDLLRGMSDTARSVSPGADRDTPTNLMYDELFEFLPIPAFETDTEGFLTRVNARSLSRFGYEPHEVLYVKRIYDVLRRDSLNRMHQGFNERRQRIKSKGNEYVAVRKDGTEFEVLIYSDGIFIDGVFQGIRGVLIDISERVAMEEDRNMLAEQLRHARRVESVGRLAAGVAHDFNNLLSPIIGYSEVVIEQLGASHPIMEDMKEILASAHSARDITRQLLTFGQKQQVQKEYLDINTVVRESAQLMRRLVPESILIEYQLSTESCDIMGDSAQLKQIMLNLFINAGDAISGKGRICLSTRKLQLEDEVQNQWNRISAGDYVVLMLTDDGRGMDEETQKRIFEPFFSTKSTDGSGLGLSTVWGIARQHDGYIEVDSSVEAGTKFAVWFPVAPAQTISGQPADLTTIAMSPLGLSVLVVDDDQRMCRLVRRLLTQQGYHVAVATNVEQAMALMRQYDGAFDLLLVDVVLPELDGKRLANELRVMSPLMRVLYMTGYGPEMLEDYDLTDEPNLIQKPFDVESLLKKVKKVFQ